MKLSFTLSSSLKKITTVIVGISVFVISASANNGLVFKSPVSTSTLVTATINSGVVYASLDAVVIDKSIIVKWVTASEQNNSHFEVERSSDMKNFKMVGLILDGFNAEGTGKAYKFKENTSILQDSKTIYYRLKQIDNDGKVSYSAVITAGALPRTGVRS